MEETLSVEYFYSNMFVFGAVFWTLVSMIVFYSVIKPKYEQTEHSEKTNRKTGKYKRCFLSTLIT